MERLLKLTRSVQWIQVRFKYRGNKQRPEKLYRRVLLDVTKPYRQDDLYDDDIDMCSIVKYRKEQRQVVTDKRIDEELYEKFLIKELNKELASCRLIAVCQLDSMGLINRMNLKNPLLDAGLRPVMYPAQACIKMLLASKYKHLAPLVNEHSIMVVAESENLTKAFIRVIKSLPTVHLLGGVVGDRVMTKQAMIQFASLPDLQTSRAHLLATLNHGARLLSSSLLHHQSSLVSAFAHLSDKPDKQQGDVS